MALPVLLVGATKAMHAALQGTPPTTRPDLDAGEEHLVVNFPRSGCATVQAIGCANTVDVPCDDPELIEAMLAS